MLSIRCSASRGLWVVGLGILLSGLVACGDASEATSSDGGVADTAATGDLAAGADTGPASDSGAIDGATGLFKVQVQGGYGSGSYAPGETVYVWSAVSTANEVALPWTDGDAALLAEPAEWRSSFVMPARDVTLTANKASQALTFTVEQYTGATAVTKTVRYFFPPAMRGVVIFSHGTGGSSTFITKPEPLAIALALVKAGYGVLGTEAEESAAGDLNGDGKQRWVTKATANNVDLKNLQLLFAEAENRGLIPAGTPKFALGMSAGGSFSHFLGTVAATPVASDFPQLRFAAVVSYCADATASKSATLSTTPSAWYMCGGEDNPEVSNQEARDNELTLRNRGIATEYAEHPPTPLYDQRFMRIPGISAATSTAIANELRAANFVDAAGFITTDGDAIATFVVANPGAFPTILAQTEQTSLRSQIKTMRAEHSTYADFTQRNIAFFERFTPKP